jgi:hypothetical protein
LEEGYQELASAEQAVADGWAQYDADVEAHDQELADYNASVADFNARSPEEQARMFVADSDGTPGEPWGSYLASRLAELDARAAELETRFADLTARESDAADLRARIDALYADTEGLFSALTP